MLFFYCRGRGWRSEEGIIVIYESPKDSLYEQKRFMKTLGDVLNIQTGLKLVRKNIF